VGTCPPSRQLSAVHWLCRRTCSARRRASLRQVSPTAEHPVVTRRPRHRSRRSCSIRRRGSEARRRSRRGSAGRTGGSAEADRARRPAWEAIGTASRCKAGLRTDRVA
jgi:hypothetical protein